MNTKTIRYLVLGLLLILMGSVAACSGAQKEGGETGKTVATQSAATKPAAKTATAGQSTTQPSGQTIDYAQLNELDSYRLAWTVKSKVGDNETEGGYNIEWTKKPLATHLVMKMTEGVPALEYILVEDTVWMKAGGQWIQVSKEELDNTIDQMGDVIQPDEGMILVGEETVNNVKCRHFKKEEHYPTSSAKLDVWIADQKNLPPVIVRGVFQMEGDVNQTMESNVTDINKHISIKPPKS